MKAIPTVRIDAYVIDALMADLVAHDRMPSAYLVYLAIWSAAGGKRAALSYADLASRTGLAKRTVQTAVAALARRELIAVERGGPTDPPRYRPLTPWRRWMRR
ncbi:MAG: helix-turn-helix domain-containing protein [Alphaproteobacteria bacterium]|nr:helix-turn-helix domain-containing protein [Alphaproteobacteria bacterium]